MTITIRNKQLEANFMNVDFVDRYEKANKNMLARTEEVKATKHASVADYLRASIGVARDFFVEVFGAETTAEIFKGAEGDFDAYLDAVAELNDQAALQRKGLNDKLNRYTQRQAARAKPQTVSFPAQHHGHGKRKH